MCKAYQGMPQVSPSASDTSAPVDVKTEPKSTSQRNVRAPATRERLPDERASVTRGFRLSYVHKDGTPDVMHFYFTPGLYPDGRVGEIFIKADKPGTLASGLMDALGVMISMLLQYGVPLETIVNKLRGTRFAPAGFTGGDPDVKNCTSPLDLLARWLQVKYLGHTSEGG
jgi:ribonucleoside-diphosphate reductase alpha chain